MCETMQSSHRLCPVMALGSASVRHCRLRLTFPEHVRKRLDEFPKNSDPQVRRHQEVTVESGGHFEDYKLAYIRFLSCHLFCPVNHE
jgi:hypothetical protein